MIIGYDAEYWCKMTEDKNYYGFVYITTNNINGKKYIGQKSYKQKNWETYLGSGVILNKSIKKYGKENFSREIIEECETKEELDQCEMYWISYYDAVSSEDFYNIASGGEGGNTIAGYSEEQLSAYKIRKSELHKKTALKGDEAPMSKLTRKDVIEIIDKLLNNAFNSDLAKEYNVSSGAIDDIRNHLTWCELTKNIEFPSITGRKRPNNTKLVCQYEEDGTLVARYENARIAEKKTGVPFKQISQVCNGNKRMAHGYIWRFDGDEFDKYETQNTYLVKVDQYDFNGNFITTFDSIKDAEEMTGCSSIRFAIKGKIKSSGGFYWVQHGEQFVMPEYKRKLRKPKGI